MDITLKRLGKRITALEIKGIMNSITYLSSFDFRCGVLLYVLIFVQLICYIKHNVIKRIEKSIIIEYNKKEKHLY